MSYSQTKRRKDGSVTESFDCIPINHKQDCPQFDYEGWFAPACICGEAYFLKEEIKAHKRRIKKHKRAVKILSELLSEHD